MTIITTIKLESVSKLLKNVALHLCILIEQKYVRQFNEEI